MYACRYPLTVEHRLRRDFTFPRSLQARSCMALWNVHRAAVPPRSAGAVPTMHSGAWMNAYMISNVKLWPVAREVEPHPLS